MTSTSVAPGGTRTRSLLAVLPAAAALVYAGIQLDGGLLAASLRASSPVPDDHLNFPLSGSVATSAEAVWGAGQLAFLVTLEAFRRRPVLTSSRTGRIGGLVALVGGILFAGGHLACMLFPNALTSDPAGVTAVSMFAAGSVFTAAGFLTAGVAVLRWGAWTAWRRFTPLLVGVWMLVMIPLQFTGLLQVAVGVYAATVVCFGLALLREER